MRTLASAGVMLAIAAATVVAGPATQASADGYTEKMKNANSGKCLVVQGDGNGNRAFQYECGPYADQRWWFDDDANPGSGIFEVHPDSVKCLTVQGYNDGAPAFQYDCTGLPDQSWRRIWLGEGIYQLKNVNSGKCLVVQGKEDGRGAIQATCDTRFADQIWRS
ncbi:RICIN domain-containing protein [Kitasatospora sp. NPDC004240]